MEAPPRGPYVRAALFAETIIDSTAGMKTIVNMLDQWTATAQGPDPPEAMPAINRQLRGLISLKPGDARGRQNFQLIMERPDGQRSSVAEGTVHFKGGPNQGVDINVLLGITFEQEGLYWFDFEMEGHLLTRMPFDVLYNRVVSGPTPEPPQGGPPD